MPDTFSCFIIGDGALAAECAAVVRAAGQRVRGLVSANAQVARWAVEQGVPLVAPAEPLADALRGALGEGESSVDWIFSVVNTRILGADVLALARRGAINYHDAPLPRYAGMHATSWAILAGERAHGVSWHRVVERVDAGDVYAQAAVPIEPGDTAFTLNAKCYVAALESFRGLVGALAAGREAPTPQELDRRTYFGRLRRPAAASILRWDRPAAELADLARGLELGPIPNPLGRARLLLGDAVLLAPRVEALDAAATGAPGTVARVGDALVVCAADRLVAVRELRTLGGAPVVVAEAARAAGVAAGSRLAVLDAGAVARLEALDAASRRGEDAWVPRLAARAPLTLPYARAAAGNGRVERVAQPVPAALGDAARALAALADAEPGELLAAACALYFRRVADADGEDVGVAAEGAAGWSAIERALFAEAAPVRAATASGATFAEAAAEVVSRMREAVARGPVLRDVVARHPALEGATVAPPVVLAVVDDVRDARRALGADLAVHVARDGAAWAWCFDPARIDAADVARMMAHVETLVVGAAAEPARAVEWLPLLGDEERRLVVEEWNRTAAPFPREATIAELVFAQAARTPGAVALVHGEREVTYAEVADHASRLARRLRALGVGPEARVGVCLTRTPALVVALLAVLEAGGAYVPLDPAYPADRLAFMLEDSGAAVVVTERAFAAEVAGAGRTLVVVDEAADEAADEADDAGPGERARATNAAYLIYTSGSTGRPKGVVIEHRSAVAFITWAHGAFSAEELAGVLAATSVCFDLSVFELFATLSAGGAVILADNALALPTLPASAAARVTLVNTVPSAMAELVRMGGLPAGVRTVNLAGEPLRTALVDRIYASGTVARVNDLYGPSEDTTYSTWTTRRAGAPATIGRPIANTYAYVLDAAGQHAPVGVPGELFLGGAGLARGYHARPELTAEKFVRDPFSADPGARLYRTGDRVRWLASGELEYLGRLDFQVKVRGFRVEPGEVEARLLAHDGVRDVIVVAREDDGERRLVAYVVAAAAAPVPTPALRAHLLGTLPDYMVPAAFVWMDALPLSSNGKVDRKRLPAPAVDRATLSREFAAPRTAEQETLAAIWARVLRVERVGVHDNFFELGGDSILMIQVAGLARRAGLALTPREMFRHQTVEELARAARPAVEAAPAPDEARAVALGAVALGVDALARLGDVEDAYALSPMQQGLLFHSLADPDGGEYQVQMRFAVGGTFDRASFRRAWDALVARHAVLRTAFAWEGVAAPVQAVLRSARMPIRELDWRDLPPTEHEARLAALMDADREEGFDLARAPLSRVTVVRTADARHEVVWNFHHLLLDGWSAHALLGELHALYAAGGDAGGAGDAPRPYRDYVAAVAGVEQGAEAFWRARLAGFAAPTPLGVDRRGAGDGPKRFARADVALSAERTAALQAFAREQRVTMNTLFQGAWAVLLSRYAGDDDVLFGATITARPATLDGAERMVGLFLNTVPVRARVERAAPVAEWLRGLQREQAEARAFEATPLADVQRWSEVAKGTPLFESLLVFENYPVAAAAPGAAAFGAPDILERTHYPLTLAAIPGERLTLRAMYDAARLDAAAVERMLAHLDAVLGAMAADGRAAVGAIEPMPEAERRRVLAWSAGASPDVAGVTVHGAFAAAARAHPSAVALATDEGSVTYAELDARANRIAQLLRARGVTRGARVALALRPSVDLVAAIVGTLKAGAAYVPVDAALPNERLRFLLDDADAPVVLAQRGLVGRLPARAGTAVVVLDDAAAELAAQPDGAPAGESAADDAAYVMYTSGSTGTPKGVVVPHRAVVRLVRGSDFMRFGADEVFLMLAPASFDASTLEIWGALLNGATLAVPTSGAPAIERLGALVRRHGVTALWLTAALFRHVVDTDLDALRPLRLLLAGGDVLPPDQVRRVLAELPGVRLINGYGPTENTTFTCCHTVTAADAASGAIPIGRPIANTTVYIVDREMRPVPTGVPGALWTGGLGVALGYLGRAELTAERFVDSPFVRGERLYFTGDRARWRDDGVVEFMGRLDGQVKLRGFRVEPGEVENTLAAHPALLAAAVTVREDRPGEKRLVGYYVPRDGEAEVGAAALREFLGARLPEYMVPSAFVRMDAFPVTANGKLDRRALPAPVRGAEERADDAPPRTDAEATLARIWSDVLRVGRVGVHDNYYELGGDSILSIQIAARAREAGLKVGVSMLAKHPTVAELAAAVGGEAAPVRAESGPVTGTAPLTPIQRWFFELDPAERDHWNQAFLFATDAELDARSLGAALLDVLAHHDALRMRFAERAGEWHQRFDAPGAPAPLWVEDLSGVPDAGLGEAIAGVTARAARSLSIERGPMLRVAYARLGGARGGRLAVAIHHLVVDGISWRVLLEDLEAAYAARLAGRAPALPPKSTSFQQWAADLSAHAASPALAAERAHWLAVSEGPLARLPGDAGASNTVGEAETVVVALDERETAELLQRVPAAYATQVNDVLLVALAEALAPWAGAGAFLLDLEGHGREDVVPDLDLTRTVGWFTSVFPVRLSLGTGTGAGAGLAARLKATKEMLRAVPRRGVGYGILRYLAGDAELAASAAPEAVFNYLGQFDQLVAGSSLLRFAPEDSGPWLSPRGRRRHALEINSLVLNGRLEFRWAYAARRLAGADVRRAAEAMLAALRAIIAHCAEPGAGGRTPSDFPLARLTQAQVDRLAGDGRDVEEIAPLAPMQALFLATTAGASDVGFEQWRFDVEGALDADAFRRAWATVTARHEIFRTSFHAEGLEAPVQVVHRRADVPFAEHDWREVPDAERAERLTRLLAADRAAGFDPARAPLCRLTLVRTGERSWTFVWSNHHLLLDRWSWPIVLGEVGAAYAAFGAGRLPSLGAPTPWRRYLAWLGERDAEGAAAFWRAELADLGAAPVPRLAGAGDGDAMGERRLDLTEAESARLMAAARERRVPVNAMVSLAWALWLARATGRDDVAYGLATSGRPEEVAGVERLVGMCINNVPVRLGLGGATVRSALAQVEARQAAAAPHAHASLADVQRWSGLPWHRRPFDTLVVFQHHGADEDTADWLGDGAAITPLMGETRTSYPLALVVAGKERLALRLAHHARFASAADADAVLAGVRAALAGLVEAADDDALAGIVAALPAPAVALDARAARPFVAPASDTEWVIARVWAELLGRDAVGADENFFDLGGQSLVATQIVSRVRDAMQMELPVSLLFEHPSVQAFARAVARREAAPGRAARVAAIIRRVEEMSVQELREAGINE